MPPGIPGEGSGAVLRFEKILVPVDFSATSRRALIGAAELARKLGGRLIVLHVIDTRGLEVAASEGFFEYVNVVGAMRGGASQELDAMLRACGAEELVERKLIEEGAPAGAIQRAAEDHQVDLIVMGTHGRTGVSRWLLGSVAEKTVRLAHCPVLVVKPLHGEEEETAAAGGD
ncbi:MAG: hypothetical protein KatS3mg102_1416 [Planctomycetota bacterium]|nr:MAG: hypothetical protein KatS3mg102_1416 [Planctomycetota bacterium]